MNYNLKTFLFETACYTLKTMYDITQMTKELEMSEMEILKWLSDNGFGHKEDIYKRKNAYNKLYGLLRRKSIKTDRFFEIDFDEYDDYYGHINITFYDFDELKSCYNDVLFIDEKEMEKDHE